MKKAMKLSMFGIFLVIVALSIICSLSFAANPVKSKAAPPAQTPATPAPKPVPVGTPSKPDLIIVGNIRSAAVPSFSGDNILVPIALRIENRGSASAGPFQLGIIWLETPPSGERLVPFSGTSSFSGLGPSSIAGGLDVTGNVSLPKSLAGKTVKIKAWVDCALRVSESSEENNKSPWLEINLPLEIKQLARELRPIGLPDLVIQARYTAAPRRVGEWIEIPFAVTMRNIGESDASIFKVYVQYRFVSVPAVLLDRIHIATTYGAPFRVPGQSNVVFPFTSEPLPPRGTITFEGILSIGTIFDRTLDENTGRVRVRFEAIADSIQADGASMPEYGRVRESHEDNNTSNPVDLEFSIIRGPSDR